MSEISPDDDVRNADWVRTLYWDVTNPDGTPVESVDQLLDFFGVLWLSEDLQRERVTLAMSDWPSMEAMPDSLLAELVSRGLVS